MRAILDTNILLSALLSPTGVTDQVYRAWREGRFELLTSNEQLEEFRRVTRYPRLKPFVDSAAAGTMHNEMKRLAVMVRNLPAVDVSADPWDNYLLAMAKGGAADMLITGDKQDLLSVGSFEHTRILTARQFLAQVGVKRKRVPSRVGAATRRKQRKTKR